MHRADGKGGRVSAASIITLICLLFTLALVSAASLMMQHLVMGLVHVGLLTQRRVFLAVRAPSI